MAYTKEKFRADFEAVQQVALDYHNMRGAVKAQPYADAWNLYTNTMNASLKMQIFGRHIFDANAMVVKFAKEVPAGQSKQMPSFMVGITQTELDNFGKTNATESGSALLTGKDGWNLTMNDVWVCGGVHSYQQFHPASPVNQKNIFDQRWILTITGRELVGLALAGYVQVSGHATLGSIFASNCNNTADSLNLVEYQVQITKLKKVGDAQAFFQKAGYHIA